MACRVAHQCADRFATKVIVGRLRRQWAFDMALLVLLKPVEQEPYE